MNYSKLLIYKIVCNDLNIKEVYVGSTVNFTRRKCNHKNCCNDVNNLSYNQSKYQFIRANGGWENWSMYEIEKYPCNDKHEGNARERYWIENLNATLNKNIPTRTDKEYREDNREKAKEYREDNKDKIKQYNVNNKDIIIEYKKEWYEINKKVILEKAKNKFTCECGSNIVLCAKQRHIRSNKHIKYIESTK
jgi:hypothetical protein